MSSNPKDTIKERDATYGNFADMAKMAQNFKRYMSDQDGWDNLKFDEKESLEMIVMKISRILNGNTHADNWHDIAGYAMLVEERIKGER